MSRQDANAAFALTSFLYGGNAAYVDNLYARYEADPTAVDAEWQAFFRSLKDERSQVVQNARGASWKLPNWPQLVRDDLVAALGGGWNEVERAVGEKLKATAQGRGVEVERTVEGSEERTERRCERREGAAAERCPGRVVGEEADPLAIR